MNAQRSASRWPAVVGAFAIWFSHFMVCWAAAEIWPQERAANLLAWCATAVALLAMAVHVLRIRAQHADGQLPGWDCRFAHGAAAIATAAIVFGALPSVVFVP